MTLRREGHARDGGHGGESLAAKPHRGDGGEILRLLNFRRGVSQNREFCILGGHAAPVIAHGKPFFAAVFEFDFDRSGARIEGIFDEFFDGTGGSFEHFAGGNLVA